MRLPLGLGSYQHRSLPLSAQRLINWQAEVQPPTAKGRSALIPTTGCTLHATVGGTGVRGVAVQADGLIAVIGDHVYEAKADGSITDRGTIDPGGPVSMDTNGEQMAIVMPETRQAFICPRTGPIEEITDPDFQGATSVTCMDGFHIFSSPDSREFFISALRDATSYDALDFASKEGLPDNLVAVQRVGRELWLFGEQSIESWTNGGGDFPFQRAFGAVIEVGCAARHSVATADGTPFWIADDISARMGNGLTPQRISTHAIEQAWAGYLTVSDARAWCYVQEGHVHYVVTFPTAQRTWVYDVTTQQWHERESEGYRGIWRCITGTQFAGGVFAGDAKVGNIYVLDPTRGDENGDAIVRVAIGTPFHAEGKQLFFRRLDIDMETGIGHQHGQGSDPKLWLSVSDDGGRTFQNERWADIGRAGEFRRRVTFRRLGSARERVFRLQMSDSVYTTIVAANFEADSGAA